MTRTRFPALDGLRAIGALAVLTTHVGFHSGASLDGPFAGLLARLDVGVAIFFAISGFLLYRPHVVAWFEGTLPPLTLPYLRNRALRILPALWVAVLLAALLVPHKDGVTWTTYLQHATLTQIYFDGLAADGLTQLWSLATEVAFYLLLPVLAKLLTGYEQRSLAARRSGCVHSARSGLDGRRHRDGPPTRRPLASRVHRLVRSRDGVRTVAGGAC
jgi:peptidoglycan/LPS O-acetylase OafA/YrhL